MVQRMCVLSLGIMISSEGATNKGYIRGQGGTQEGIGYIVKVGVINNNECVTKEWNGDESSGLDVRIDLELAWCCKA